MPASYFESGVRASRSIQECADALQATMDGRPLVAPGETPIYTVRVERGLLGDAIYHMAADWHEGMRIYFMREYEKIGGMRSRPISVDFLGEMIKHLRSFSAGADKRSKAANG